MNWQHTSCQQEHVVTVVRTIYPAPDDRNWPKEVTLKLPYCLDCRRLVPFDELIVPFDETDERKRR